MTVSVLQHSYPAPGDLVDGKYEVQRVIGAGAMGAVIEATHVLRKARVALKFMSPRLVEVPGVVERFFNEGVAASRINNDHVVNILDVSELPNGLPYLVMEYLDGEDLEGLLAREGGPGLSDITRAVHFVLQVLRGLQAAHQVGIIHRDLKPANCFVVAKDGEPDFIKLVDFGISKVQEKESEGLNLTQVGSTLGTPLYVSPEQARNAANVDARGDLYSVAVILYELVCGRAPFEAESGQLSELFMMLATEMPAPLDSVRGDVPPQLAQAVAKGLAKNPNDRYQSAAEMAQALAAFADSRSDLVLRQLLSRPSIAAGRIGSELPRTTAVAYPVSRPPASSTVRAERTGTKLSEPPAPAAHPAHGTAPGLGISHGGSPPARQRLPLVLAAAALVLALGAAGVWSLSSGERAAPSAQPLPPPQAAAAAPVAEPATATPASAAPNPSAAPSANEQPASSAATAEPPAASNPASDPSANTAPASKPPAGTTRRTPSLSKIRIED